MDVLKPEDDPRYLNKSAYLHGDQCGACKKELHSKISPMETENKTLFTRKSQCYACEYFRTSQYTE